MDWSKFDMKLLLSCPRYAGRLLGALEELRRIECNATVLSNPDVPNDADGFPRGLFVAHRNAYRSFLGSPCRRLLVVEDDVRFLLDTERLQAVLDALPDDADEARLCWGGARGDVRGAGLWHEVERCRGSLYMTACYSLSRQAAEESLGFFDDVLHGRRERLNIDLQAAWRAKDRKIYICSPPAAIVTSSSGVSGSSARDALLSDAAFCGVVESDFAR